MKKMLWPFIAILFLVTACSPVTIEKKVTEYNYSEDGKLINTYSETLTQTPEKTLPVHLRHQELYE